MERVKLKKKKEKKPKSCYSWDNIQMRLHYDDNEVV